MKKNAKSIVKSPENPAKAVSKTISKILNDSEKVDEYMHKLDHPFKAEVQVIRDIILNANKEITEGIKWNAPCFYYKGDMVVFSLHRKQHVLMVLPSGS